MSCLNAKALQTDPDGMAFLRDVIAPPVGESAVKPRPFAVSGRGQRNRTRAENGKTPARDAALLSV